MIIAGEASGDLHASRLVRAMNDKDPSFFFFGIGGNALKDAGVRILFDSSELAVVGITEVFSKIPHIFKALSTSKNLLKSLRPELIILVDYPDFNFKVAAYAKKLGIPVLYYISPQIWAWRQGRLKKIKKIVDYMAVILPFEAEYYKKQNIPVSFVGHPLLEADAFQKNKEINIKKEDETNLYTIGLLPGSRYGEILRHLPVLLESAEILNNKLKNIKFIISRASSVKKEFVEDIVNKHRGRAEYELTSDSVINICAKSSLIVAASGTVTLETAITGTPMVIIYKMSAASYWLGRALISVPHIGLANLVAGKSIVPELIQSKASPENIAEKVYEMLNNPSELKKIREELFELRKKLGGIGASKRVTDIAAGMLNL